MNDHKTLKGPWFMCYYQIFKTTFDGAFNDIFAVVDFAENMTKIDANSRITFLPRIFLKSKWKVNTIHGISSSKSN